MNQTPREIYLDFEYRDDAKQNILCCLLFPDGTRRAIDFRRPDAAGELSAIIAANPTATWFSYSAHAELNALRVAGIEFRDMKWVCLMAEARQITLSHAGFLAKRGSLLKTLEVFGIATAGNVQHKEAMRALILATDQYTPEQWAAIVEYCHDDITPLPELWRRIKQVHADQGHAFHLQTAHFHGDYLKALCHLEGRSRGLPIDVPLLERVFTHQKAVRREIAQRCNEKYGCSLFRYNRSRDEFSFHFASLAKHIDSLPFPVEWATTPAGRLRMDDEYLTEFCRKNPHFGSLKYHKDLLSQLKTGDLRDLLSADGFIKPVSLPFYTVTGRNQPLSKRGFLLNLPPWLRRLVRPQPGYVLIAGDWSQQEIVIAAILSGDPELKAALESGDIYLALAKLAGAVPADATKDSHPAERQTYKAAQLGIGYGMGTRTLGKRIYFDLADRFPITVEEADGRARDIYDWHKARFDIYWAYIEREVAVARDRGWIHARDGWTVFADRQSFFTKLQNFPAQANAAVILREAIKNLSERDEIEYVCSLHDAVYLYAPEDKVAAHTAILKDCMDRATCAVVGDAIPINVEIKVYGHQDGLTDDKGRPIGGEMYQRILAILDAEEAKLAA